MGRKGFWIATIGIVFGFLGGFLFANMLNRQEIDSLKSKVAQVQDQKMQLGDAEPKEQELSADELKSKIQKADENPGNSQYQKDLGLSLYLYASMQKNTALLPDAKRLMLRGLEKFPTDYDLLVSMGNLSFDLGQSTKENKNYDEARGYYTRALVIKPKQVDLQTDIGSTYFLSDPPQYEKALAEYRKALQIDPEHLRSVDNLTRTLLMMGQVQEGESSLANLKKLDANYPGVADLEKLLTEKKQTK